MSNKLVERTIMLLLSQKLKSGDNGGKRFYGNLLSNMRKHYNNKQIETAAVSVTNQINLYINTEFFESLTEKQRIEVLIHECDHLVNNHPKRFKKLDESDAKLFNIACDAAINEPLTSLHEFGVTVDALREFIPNLKKGETAEYYYKKLKDYREQNGGKGGKGENDITQSGKLVDDHDAWKRNEDQTQEQQESESGGQIDEITQETIKRAVKDAVERSGGRGHVPMNILAALDRLSGATVDWRQQLKQFFAKANKFNKKPTRKKLNRRYKHLNPGRRKDPVTHIAIAIDNSGSICNNLFQQFFAEIETAYKIGNINFTIIQADCEVNSIQIYNPKSPINRTGGGGTAYMPAINKASELLVDGMIYFGDGDIFGEVLEKPKFPFLWAMEEGREPPANWGKVCHVKYRNEY